MKSNLKKGVIILGVIGILIFTLIQISIAVIVNLVP